jgi:16S rRNA (adenine1518-N6/adenine1519-N6)-dimethyltransferase
MVKGGGFLLSQTKKQLRSLDLRARKGLGQHFLVDNRVLKRIVSAAKLAATDTVVEVGPGLGILTKELARRAGRVIAIELDPKLASALEQALASIANVTIVNADVLESDPGALIRKGEGDVEARYKVVANLPYYVASAVVRHFLEAGLKPQLMVITVQKEVAQVMVAQPGKMSLMSVSVQFYGKPSIVDYVSARSFYPAPKVDSAIVRIELYDHHAVEVEDVAQFFEVVRGGFAAPRKQLHNSLAQGLKVSSAEAAALLQRAGISQERRAQTLTLEEWARVCRVFGATALEEQC